MNLLPRISRRGGYTTRGRAIGKHMDSSTAYNLPRLCEATNKDGGPCRGYAVTGSDYCFWHDPALADRRKLARTKGGRARHGRALGAVHRGQPVHIAELADVVKVLEAELNALLTLEKSISRARAVGYLCGVLVKVYKDTELEARIVALEAQAK